MHCFPQEASQSPKAQPRGQAEYKTYVCQQSGKCQEARQEKAKASKSLESKEQAERISGCAVLYEVR